MNKFDPKKAILKFSEAKVYVVGDIILDEYLWCSVDRISPEAPVPIAKISKKTVTLGGAANVANNITSLGGKAILIGRVGKDTEGKVVEKICREKKIDSYLIGEKEFNTITKTRVVSGIQHIVRIDKEIILPLEKKSEDKIIAFIKKIPKKSIVIVSDYAKGTVTEKIAKVISNLSKTKKIIVLVDPTPKTISKIQFPFLVKPNKEEAETAANQKIEKNGKNLLDISNTIKKNTRAENILITLGPDGMALSLKNSMERLPVFVRDVYDVSGAGDTVIAVVGASLSTGLNLKNAILLSAIASGLVVEKLGTATCTQKELINFLDNHSISEYVES